MAREAWTAKRQAGESAGAYARVSRTQGVGEPRCSAAGVYARVSRHARTSFAAVGQTVPARQAPHVVVWASRSR